MNQRTWTLLGVTAALGLAYVLFYTDWVSPEPIQIASQVRPVIQQPRFGRRARAARPDAVTGVPDTGGNPRTEERPNRPPGGSAPMRGEGAIAEPANGVAHVTFSLDDRYSITSLKVVEVKADGTEGKVAWNLKGKSRPLNGLIYGMNPSGLTPASPDGTAVPLEAGIQYRLEVSSGRRRGSNVFQTVQRPPPTGE